MHLSRAVLNVESAAARRDIANPYEMHRTLRRCAPTGGLLWRLENTGYGLPTVLVQSEEGVDWSQIAVVEPSYCAVIASTKHYDPSFSEGTPLRFRLRANPSIRQGGKRHGVSTREGQADWLERKAQAGGFKIFALAVRDERLMQAGKPGHFIQVASVLYDGRLLVTDSNLFSACLRSGIGPAKSLGFGLLSVAREKS
ncbi:MAG: type I-E CRISPR-associated protein Cas6/Cse3/CasE [Candidatus Bipolaricaulota bacterium]